VKSIINSWARRYHNNYALTAAAAAGASDPGGVSKDGNGEIESLDMADVADLIAGLEAGAYTSPLLSST
jgi:hypothetical protein